MPSTNDDGLSFLRKTDELPSNSFTSRKFKLFNFPPVRDVYSMCPFGLKLESFLRINKIPHEMEYTLRMSKTKGGMPYVHLISDGKDEILEIPDSNIVMNLIQKSPHITTTDAALTPEQKAVAHSFIRMLEEHTAQIGFHYRYGIHIEEYAKAVGLEERMPPGMAPRWVQLQPMATQSKSKYRGLLRHSEEELWDMSMDDIQAISDYLGQDKKYLFGDTPTSADCAVYGHLSQFMWIQIDFPQQAFIKEKCPNLVAFMDRFKQEFWSDWDELCAINANEIAK